jgi:hypothetical protein
MVNAPFVGRTAELEKLKNAWELMFKKNHN